MNNAIKETSKNHYASIDEVLVMNKKMMTTWRQSVMNINEPRYEKTGFLHMRKQRRRSASRRPRS